MNGKTLLPDATIDIVKRIAASRGARTFGSSGSVARGEYAEGPSIWQWDGAGIPGSRWTLAGSGRGVRQAGRRRIRRRPKPSPSRANSQRSRSVVKDDRVYLLHVQDAIRRIQSYVTGGCQGFLRDDENSGRRSPQSRGDRRGSQATLATNARRAPERSVETDCGYARQDDSRVFRRESRSSLGSSLRDRRILASRNIAAAENG